MAQTTDPARGPLLRVRNPRLEEDSYRTFLQKPTGDDAGDPSLDDIFDAEAEARLVWKFDLYILPCLSIMYFANCLDKSSISNAKTAGLEHDLGLHGDQYNTALSIFYIPYVFTAPFLGVIGKFFGPSRVLPCMMMTFGTMALMMTTVQGFHSLLAVRWFSGMAESAFYPLSIYYLTTFYRRGELARRLAGFFAASSFAYAFGGMLAYFTFQVENDFLYKWMYFYVFEGACAIIFAIFAFWWLPNNAASANFLTKAEKRLAHHRMQIDSSAVVDSKFVFKDAVRILRHPTSWVVLLIQICIGVPMQSVGLFLPTIVGRFGYSAIKTNLYTVAPNLTGAAMLLILALLSDHTKLRFPFVALGFAFTCVGFATFARVDIQSQSSIAYLSCFMMTWGTAAPSVLLNTWWSNNIADESKRVLLTSIGVPLANLMGIVSSQVFLPSESPTYPTALKTTAAFGAVGCFLTLMLGVWMFHDNSRRDRVQGVKVRARDIPTESMAKGPTNLDYRWFL